MITQRLRSAFLMGVIAVLLVMAGFFAGTSVFSSMAATNVALTISQQTLPLNDLEQRYADVYNKVSPSTVAINVSSNLEAGSGSGFVVDTQGHIVTNYHVVAGGEEIEVNFFDGTITRAQIVGLDPDSDLAVIKVDLPQERLIPVTFADSNALITGQQVIAIGSPFGERWTMTAGIISALNRTISGFNAGFSIGGAIQTDAPINPGNSGGPLLNLNGEVIGVNAQIRSETRSNSGIGFAIPSNLVRRVTEDIISTGRVNYAYIGIRGTSVSLDIMESLNLPNNTRGVVVTDVLSGGPAASAGLRSAQVTQSQTTGDITIRSADIITRINGVEVNGMDALISYLAAYSKPNDTVTLDVLRDGQMITLTLTLGFRPTS